MAKKPKPETKPETKPPPHLPGEITVGGKRLIWERHSSGAFLVDLMLMQGDSETLTATASLVLAYPKFARASRFKRNLGEAAARLYDYLESKGWDIGDILRAGRHAFVWLANQLPPTSGSDEVIEAEDFSEPRQDDTPAG